MTQGSPPARRRLASRRRHAQRSLKRPHLLAEVWEEAHERCASGGGYCMRGLAAGRSLAGRLGPAGPPEALAAGELPLRGAVCPVESPLVLPEGGLRGHRHHLRAGQPPPLLAWLCSSWRRAAGQQVRVRQRRGRPSHLADLGGGRAASGALLISCHPDLWTCRHWTVEGALRGFRRAVARARSCGA